MIYSVILAGGKGERFWPLSRASRPKQLLKLTSDKTMLQETIDRILPLAPLEQTLIVTGQVISDSILKEIDYLKSSHLLTEPQGRNTLLAIGLAAIHIEKNDPEGVMLTLSADHLIKPPERLRQLLKVGANIAAKEDKLITLGIVPTRAETGYGYIKLGETYKLEAGISVFAVEEFTEKPRRQVAQEYYHDRKHLWNSGIFIWSVRSILLAFEKHQPDAYRRLRDYSKMIGTADEFSAREELYDNSEGISIDFAIMEKASNVLTMKADIIWDDVGSWNSLQRYMKQDDENNVLHGNVICEDSYEMTVYNDSAGLVTTLGVSDLVVVRSGEVVLVAHKTKVEEIKKLLDRVRKTGKADEFF
ncbi:MAG: mannose-1-phosphate guanylyltransferase [candidate division Zixibacteria bacterium]|nr:mannose-1-phosphate guanylyltransferase [candidate division Zixibacteria bacterium]